MIKIEKPGIQPKYPLGVNPSLNIAINLNDIIHPKQWWKRHRFSKALLNLEVAISRAEIKYGLAKTPTLRIEEH